METETHFMGLIHSFGIAALHRYCLTGLQYYYLKQFIEEKNNAIL